MMSPEFEPESKPYFFRGIEIPEEAVQKAKMASSTEELRELADRYNIEITDDIIKAALARGGKSLRGERSDSCDPSEDHDSWPKNHECQTCSHFMGARRHSEEGDHWLVKVYCGIREQYITIDPEIFALELKKNPGVYYPNICAIDYPPNPD